MKMLKIQFFGDDINNFFRDLVLITMRTREKRGVLRPDLTNILERIKMNLLLLKTRKLDSNL